MGATFPLMDKCNVNGPETHEVFRLLRKKTNCFTNPKTGKIKNIPWNFAKFIIDANGEVVIYSNPRQSLYKSIDEIESLLGLKTGSEVDFKSGLHGSVGSGNQFMQEKTISEEPFIAPVSVRSFESL
jgi:hypothetical protein